MSNLEIDRKIVLTESEFEYVQQMVDYGSAMSQAILEVRPELHGESWNVQDSILIVRRSPGNGYFSD